MGKGINKYNWSVMTVIISIIWAPIQAFVEFDGANRVPFLLLLLTVYMYWPEINKYCFKKPLVFYIVLAPYMFINGLAHNSQLLYGSGGLLGIYLMAFSIFQPIMLMLIICCLARHHYDKTLKWTIIAILAYCLLCFLSGQMTEYADEGVRLSSIINSNEVALMIAIGFSLVLLSFIRKQIKLISFLLLSVLLVVADLATGSRMGFVMIGIVVVFSIFLLSEKKKIGSILLSILLLVGFYLVLTFLLDNTFVGKRLLGSTTQTETMQMATGTIWDKFGDRGLQYYYSWPYFIEHPVFGIGFRQWKNVGFMELVCHSEYLVQYMENGLVAMSLYLCFFLGIIRNLWRKRFIPYVQDSKTCKVLFCTMLSIMFANFVLWTYNSTGVFAVYGFAYAFISIYQGGSNNNKQCIY